MRVSTVSGVMIFSGILLLNPGVGGPPAAGAAGVCAYALVRVSAPASAAAMRCCLWVRFITVCLSI